MTEGQDGGPRWDKCIAHAIKSVAIGATVGLIGSTLIFKRKKWAFLLGIGYGLGVALSGCDYELNQKEILPICDEDGSNNPDKKKKKT